MNCFYCLSSTLFFPAPHSYYYYANDMLVHYLFCRLERLFSRSSSQQPKKDPKKDDNPSSDAHEDDLVVERIRLENMDLRFICVSTN